MLLSFVKWISRLPIGSRSDWLAELIEVAGLVMRAEELAPFPSIKGAAESLLVLLRAVEVCPFPPLCIGRQPLSLAKQKIDKNKDDARIPLESIVKLIVTIRDDVKRHGDFCVTLYAEPCKALAASVFDVAMWHSLS
jgi:hypothetical protein